MRSLVLVICVVLFGCSKNGESQSESASVPAIGYTVVNSFPHDTRAFTEGLLIHKGRLYESTGDKESWIGVVDIKTGVAARKVQLDPKYFGEGMSILNNKVYYLTYRHNTGFVYDLNTFKELRQFSYKTEGWGMTTDNTNLIMSDGTPTIHFLDTASLEPVRTISVTHNGEPLKGINELEYIDGFIYANVWQTSTVVKIDMNSGAVVGTLDLSELTKLAQQIKPGVDVLNGLAWHPQTKQLIVTGKLWPVFYVLKLK